jgi:hypothetical protein
MSEKSRDNKAVQERTSKGGKAPESLRRAGISLARPGHFSAVPQLATSGKRQRTSGARAVRAKINPISLPGKKD